MDGRDVQIPLVFYRTLSPLELLPKNVYSTIVLMWCSVRAKQCYCATVQQCHRSFCLNASCCDSVSLTSFSLSASFILSFVFFSFFLFFISDCFLLENFQSPDVTALTRTFCHFPHSFPFLHLSSIFLHFLFSPYFLPSFFPFIFLE